MLQTNQALFSGTNARDNNYMMWLLRTSFLSVFFLTLWCSAVISRLRRCFYWVDVRGGHSIWATMLVAIGRNWETRWICAARVSSHVSSHIPRISCLCLCQCHPMLVTPVWRSVLVQSAIFVFGSDFAQGIFRLVVSLCAMCTIFDVFNVTYQWIYIGMAGRAKSESHERKHATTAASGE